MRLGKLNRRITIRRLVEGQRDVLNAPVQRWADVGTIFAQKMQQSPVESWKAGQTAAQSEEVFRVRWTRRTAAITPKDRLIEGSTTYDIIGTREPVLRAVIDLVCIAATDK